MSHKYFLFYIFFISNIKSTKVIFISLIYFKTKHLRKSLKINIINYKLTNYNSIGNN